MKKAIVTVDLGFGDSGKGTITAALVKKYNSDLVVRYSGGFQAAHHVYPSDHVFHRFSQFGSGTFDGAKTLIGPNVIINPLTMQHEANRLVELGVKDPMNLMHVDRRCIIATPYHKALNRIREFSRRTRHGSTGEGIGEARRMSISREALTLRASELENESKVLHKIEWIAEQCALECHELIHDYQLCGLDAIEAMAPFNEKSGMTKLMDRYKQWYSSVHILSFINQQVLLANSHVPVFEAAHGVLLDKRHGFHPYTTWSDTTDKPAWDMLVDIYEPEEVYHIGITRTYMTRHGDGPFASEITSNYIDAKEGAALIADDDNASGQYQGSMRVGFHDLVALRYAQRCLKRPLDGLAVTHCDKLNYKAVRFICTKYFGADLDNYKCEKEASLQALSFTGAYQAVQLSLEPVNPAEVPEFLAKGLGVPLVIKSFGKRTDQKVFMGMPQEDGFVDKKAAQTPTPDAAQTTAPATPEPAKADGTAPAPTTTAPTTVN